MTLNRFDRGVLEDPIGSCVTGGVGSLGNSLWRLSPDAMNAMNAQDYQYANWQNSGLQAYPHPYYASLQNARTWQDQMNGMMNAAAVEPAQPVRYRQSRYCDGPAKTFAVNP